MQIISDKLDNIPVREIVTYRYDDMMVYLSATAFFVMGVIFMVILSL